MAESGASSISPPFLIPGVAQPNLGPSIRSLTIVHDGRGDSRENVDRWGNEIGGSAP